MQIVLHILLYCVQKQYCVQKHYCGMPMVFVLLSLQMKALSCPHSCTSWTWTAECLATGQIRHDAPLSMALTCGESCSEMPLTV